ncbi:MAG TPA: hypothetical protein VFZ34_29190 [Blastocatellia bacterium]|nr:hypothetical protein [Blastocatellia bacterium]
MLSYHLQPLLWVSRVWQPGFLLLTLLLVVSFGSTRAVWAQGASLVGVCPQSCGVNIQITRAAVTEANDGVEVKVDWTMNAPNPALKLEKLLVAARADLGLDNVKNSVEVGVDKRTATIKLSRLLEFDFKDIKKLEATVTAFANPLAPVVASVTSRGIVGQSTDPAVEVKWNKPAALACTAAHFFVDVSALNEKNDKLTGQQNVALDTLTTKVELKGAINKKGLQDPEATVKVIHNALGCQAAKTFPAGQFNAPAGAGTGSFGADAAKITLTKLALRDDGTGRVDAEANWEVFEPTNIKVSDQVLKFEIEDVTGKITTRTGSAPDNQRTATVGSLAAINNFRRATLTITATFQNDSRTTIVTREDKKTATLLAKQIPLAATTLPSKAPDLGLAITTVKAVSNGVETAWKINVPAGVSVTSFDIEAQLGKTQNKLTVAGQERQAAVKLDQTAAGTLTPKVQVKLTANGRQANGATFQQSVTREETLLVPPAFVPTPLPTGLQVSLTNVQLFFETNIRVRSDWQIQVPANFTVLTNEVEYTLFGTTRNSTKKVTLASTLRQHEILFGFSELGGEEVKRAVVTVKTLIQRPDLTNITQTATREQAAPAALPVQLSVTKAQSEKAGGNLIVHSAWQIQVPTGATLESFNIEATLLKPTGPVKKSIALAANFTQRDFTFSSTEANGFTGVEVKVTANLRRANGSTFQVTATGTGN